MEAGAKPRPRVNPAGVHEGGVGVDTCRQRPSDRADRTEEKATSTLKAHGDPSAAGIGAMEREGERGGWPKATIEKGEETG